MILLGATLCCALVQAEPNNAPPARKLAGYSASEPKPVQLDAEDAAKKGKDKANAKIQAHFDERVAPIVAKWNAGPHADGAARLVIEPRVDGIKKVGGATRFFAGALAGDSRVTMHVRIVEQPGDVVVADYLDANYDAAVGGGTGRTE
jgi:hypothetical protein